ncbi:MAG: hypothetical protein WBH44_10890 [Proteocatella sp.]
MKATKVFTMIDDTLKKIEKSDAISGANQEKMVTQLLELRKIYQDVDVKPDRKAVYDALKQKGEWLKSQFNSQKDPKKLNREVNNYIHLLKASLADFSGESDRLVKFYQTFFIMSLLFLGLSPQRYGTVMSLFMIMPVIGALRGIRDRRKIGFYLAVIISPIALITGLDWMKLGFEVLSDYSGQVAKSMELLGRGELYSTFSITVFPLLGLFMFIISMITMYRSYKVKDMFV